MVIATEFT